MTTLCTVAETGTAVTCPPILLNYADMRSFSLRLIAIEMATRSLIMLGRNDDAWTVIQTTGLDCADDLVEYHPLKLIPHARASVASGKGAAVVSGLIEDALVYAGKIGERLVRLQLLALLAWQQRQLGDKTRAKQRLMQAVHLVEDTGYVRVLLDIPGLVEWVPACASRRQGQCIACAAEAAACPAAGAVAPCTPLS